VDGAATAGGEWGRRKEETTLHDGLRVNGGRLGGWKGGREGGRRVFL